MSFSSGSGSSRSPFPRNPWSRSFAAFGYNDQTPAWEFFSEAWANADHTAPEDADPTGLYHFSTYDLHVQTALAEELNWGSLNLNESQMSNIQQAEQEWRSVSSDLMPQIQRDREELQRLLNSDGDPRRILELQQRISNNKQKLDQTALQTFLKKKQLNN